LLQSIQGQCVHSLLDPGVRAMLTPHAEAGQFDQSSLRFSADARFPSLLWRFARGRARIEAWVRCRRSFRD
jgi:hypothetical protein